MKQSELNAYARALADLCGERLTGAKEKKVIGAFIGLLEKKALFNSAEEIIEKAEQYFLDDEGGRKVVLATARPLTPGQRKVLAGFSRKGDVVREEIDQSLLSGVKVTVNDSLQFDYSLRRKLEEMFNKKS